MAKIIDINGWSENPWFNTGGTRNKKIFSSPEGKLFYFKESYYRPGRNYKLEFWSEVIASFIGKMLGLNVLEYEVAFYESKIGCISAFMIDTEKQELVEGGKYLQAFDSTFIVENAKPEGKYSFQLIHEALQHFYLDKHINKVIELIVFDAVIGNGDRHQENWAFIVEHTRYSKAIHLLESTLQNEEMDSGLSKWFTERFLAKKDKKTLKPEVINAKYAFQRMLDFAPIYDNGSSLGRELTDQKVQNMLKNPDEMEAFVKRGESEIHWEGKKITHEALIQQLLLSNFVQITTGTIKTVVSKFNEEVLKRFINHIDSELPKEFEDYKIPSQRKEMIVKMVALRVKRIGELIQ